MADAARVALSKAHAMSYTHLAYRSAYLKAHYPRQFMTALLDVNNNHPDRLEVLSQEAARMGLDALRQGRG
jgi:DNA polymerase-3 subunit alpha